MIRQLAAGIRVVRRSASRGAGLRRDLQQLGWSKAAELAKADLGLVMVRADDGSVSVEASYGTCPNDLRGLVLPAESAVAVYTRTPV